ncbi:MAG: NAD(P)/FAD-dependent oxidoreductase [Bacteroidota bacterium]
MSSNATPPIHLAGAGLAGSLLALLLAQQGHEVEVYERRPDMRKAEISAGRSINLALSVRGMYALEMAGLKEEVMKLAIPMPGRMMHAVDGDLTFQPYSNDPENAIYSVSRGLLNQLLMDHAEASARVRIHFQHRIEEVDFNTGDLKVKNLQTGGIEDKNGIILACDGAFSAVRYAMQKTPRFDFSQSYLNHGYKELSIPPAADGSHRMDPNALHIWPRGGYMLIALPNLDGSFTCTLFFPYEGEESFDSLQTPEQVQAFFERVFPDTLPLMPELLQDYQENPTASLVTIRCYPWVWEDKVALLGDASHAIVPFFGQGMNAAFEDCAVFMECLRDHGPGWGEVFQAYQEARKPNADAIADMALENYIEMRDKVADERFLFRKQVEHHLESHHEAYKSRYELVSFSRVPYAEAYHRGIINQQILDRLTEGKSKVSEIDLEQAGTLIQEFAGK